MLGDSWVSGSGRAFPLEDRSVGAYAGRPGLLGAAASTVVPADRASSSSVLQAKPVLTPRSRASPVTLAGGRLAAGSETTTAWADGLTLVSVSAAAA